MLLEACILGAMKAICGIGRTVENEKSKRDTAKLTPEGNVMSIGRTGQVYINGEQTYEWTETDKYGRSHNLTIGCNSGKVYSDSYDRWTQRMIEETERNKEYAINHGRCGYADLTDTRFEEPVLRELSTGKIITCIYQGSNWQTHEKEWRKWYLTDACYQKYGRQAYNHTEDGDMGIPISKKEYYNLQWIAKPSNLPSDGKVLNVLFGTNCF